MKSSNNKKISPAVIKRLPRYYRYLSDLLSNNITRISSHDLSEKINLTASQIRQDLNNFGCFGQQGYGYNVSVLHDEIQKILGLTKTYNIIIIGAGKLGQAIVNYHGFEKRGFRFIAMFDIDENIVGKCVNNVQVMHIDMLDSFLKSNTVDIAAFTLPRANADGISDVIFSNGVKGVWNFSHTDLEAPEGTAVENVHLTDSLMILSYQLNEND